jgi:hypothetical protein
MKKIILMIVTGVLMANYCNAQRHGSDFSNELQFGLKIGVNYSNVYDTQGEQFNADPKFGIATGAFLSIPITRYFGFQPEILYSQKGFKATGSILGGDYDFTRTTTFIDIPLLLQVKPSSKITLLIGPQYSYLLKQRDVFNNSTTTINQQQEFENENIRRNILCILSGIDLNLNNNLVISARVGWDLSNNNGDGTSSTPRYRNVWYQATLGLKF